MAMRPITPPTEAEVARLVVLGAIARGMTFSYAARTAAISITDVREIANAAGWPDVDAVKDVHATLRDATSKPGRKRVAPAPRTTEQAEREYRGEVVQTGPTPAHREPLAAYVARVVEPIETALNDELQLPPGARVEFDTTPLLNPAPLLSLLTHFGVDVEGKTITVAGAPSADDVARVGGSEPSATGHVHDRVCAQEELFCPDNRNGLTPGPGPIEPLPPTTDSPAPSVKRSATRPGTVPCKGCGKGVTTAYVERTGAQLHGHCREES